MPRYPAPYATGSAIALPLVFLLISATIIVGLAGQEPTVSVRFQDSYQVGKTGFIAISIDNRWWGRNITVLSISMSIAGGTPTELLQKPQPMGPLLSSSRTLGLILNLTVPQGTPIGTQPYQITIIYTQSKILFFGEDVLFLVTSGTLKILY